ncbi:MAG: tRNA uridine-5-carboxymethylaminomethyl(34) synthesis GTPase MnmE [Desulfovibrionaceae bacterium]|nr:tRNA uridine-5-carboxymethylaminomethyl(34) synthesis GTPase MnmE [Desulfovibrionaceae bacterium]
MILDTIAAIATPPGLGGIAVLRLSGPGTLAVLSRLFRPKSLGHGAAAASFAFIPRHMHYGDALDAGGERLDDVLAVYMPGPHSVTGEDVGEIHCHGGSGVTTALLEAALACDARLAGPGEFTRRAFLNGRMDLTQAEAVAEMISAPTREGVRLAAAKLDGALAREIRAVRDALDALRIQVALCVDFPDEDAELLSRPGFERTIDECKAAVRRLLAAFERARLWREGALAVLVGPVNAGKSSLLNALLGRERAIVSPAPGTTRDYIEESVNIRGVPLRLVDTAGLRESGDVVEAEGMRRSRDLAEEADVLLFVVDISAPPQAEESEFLRRASGPERAGRLLLVLNKVDVLAESLGPQVASATALARGRALLAAMGDEAASCGVCFPVSAKLGQGMEELSQGLLRALRDRGGSDAGTGDVAPNLRQAHLLREALGDLEQLSSALALGHPPDILGIHLETAALALAEVTGVLDNEAMLDSIFSSFCIGK